MSRKILLSVVFFICCAALCAGDFVLYRNGRPQAEILLEKLPSSLIARERDVAASYIKGFNSQIAKCRLKGMKIVKKRTPGKNTIVIRIENKNIFNSCEYKIDFPDRNSMRITASYYSLKYAFDDLLERCFGVRFLMFSHHLLKPPAGYDRSIEYVYPAVKNVSIARKTIVQKPSFNLRRVGTGMAKEWRPRSSFAASHGMTRFPFPARKYAVNDSWPQEILPIHNGKKLRLPKLKKPDPKRINNLYYMRVQRFVRYTCFWQPCFSNPKTAEIASANIIEIMDKEPIDPLYSYKRTSFCLGLNDCGGHCKCNNCLRIVNGQKGPLYANYSEVYWKWVNKVAETVTKKYPNVYFCCLAYREVYLPPSFKLHPNVIPVICRELNAGSCPAEKKEIEKVFRNWKEKAARVMLWDYVYGATYYVFPRVFFNVHADMMKMAYANNVRGIYCEGTDRINMGGPSHYIIAKTMWDVNVDVNALLKQWCIDAVGAKAAPELERYYKFWENYWLRKEIRQTNYFNSVKKIYMSLGDSGSYTYAIRKGEMAYLRKLLENVVKKAQTPGQKARAKHFLNVFAISEDAAKCLYSEYIEPNGYVKDAAAAVALLRSVPEACKALERQKKNPLVNAPAYKQKILRPMTTGVSNLRCIEKLVKEPSVRKELARLAENKEVLVEIRSLAKILLGVPFKNLLENGSFEKPLSPQNKDRLYWGKINTKLASHGKRSFGKVNPLVRVVKKEGLTYGKKYMVLVDVYAEKNSSEGVAELLFNPRSAAGKNTNFVQLSGLKLNKGWQTLSNTIVLQGDRLGKACQIMIQIRGQRFEQDEPIYFDNIRLYQLD